MEIVHARPPLHLDGRRVCQVARTDSLTMGGWDSADRTSGGSARTIWPLRLSQ